MEIFLKDHKGETIAQVIDQVRTFIAENQNLMKKAVMKPAGGLGGAELADHVVQRGEVDAERGLAGRHRQGHGEVGLADAGRSLQQDRFLAADPGARRQRLDP